MEAENGRIRSFHQRPPPPSAGRGPGAAARAPEAEKRLTRHGAKRITAFVEKDHASATAFWQAVGYAPDGRIDRHVRTLKSDPS